MSEDAGRAAVDDAFEELLSPQRILALLPLRQRRLMPAVRLFHLPPQCFLALLFFLQQRSQAFVTVRRLPPCRRDALETLQFLTQRLFGFALLRERRLVPAVRLVHLPPQHLLTLVLLGQLRSQVLVRLFRPLPRSRFAHQSLQLLSQGFFRFLLLREGGLEPIVGLANLLGLLGQSIQLLPQRPLVAVLLRQQRLQAIVRLPQRVGIPGEAIHLATERFFSAALRRQGRPMLLQRVTGLRRFALVPRQLATQDFFRAALLHQGRLMLIESRPHLGGFSFVAGQFRATAPLPSYPSAASAA